MWGLPHNDADSMRSPAAVIPRNHSRRYEGRPRRSLHWYENALSTITSAPPRSPVTGIRFPPMRLATGAFAAEVLSPARGPIEAVREGDPKFHRRTWNRANPAALLADAGYTGGLSHNPMSAAHGPGFVTNWLRRDPYTLPELGEVIPLGWRKPTIAGTAIGRNCSMFDALRRV